MRRRRVAVEIERAGGLQDAAHLHKPNAHEAEEGAHVVAITPASELDYAPDFGVAVLYGVLPSLMRVSVPRPAVLKARAARQAVGRGVKIAPLVEGRIGRYQVDGLAVHPLQDGQIVAVKQRSVLEVGSGMALIPFAYWIRLVD